jgi:hypothetical protein
MTCLLYPERKRSQKKRRVGPKIVRIMKSSSRKLLASAVGLIAVNAGFLHSETASAVTIYAVTAYGVGSQAPSLVSIDSSTGATKTLQTINNADANNTFSPNGLGYDSQNGLFYYDTYASASGDQLYSVNAKTGQNLSVGPINAANATGAFYHDTYYYIAQGGTDIQRIRINPDGSTTSLGGMGYDFDPVGAGDLAISSDGKLYFSGGLSDTGGDVLMVADLANPNMTGPGFVTRDGINVPVTSLLKAPTLIGTSWFGQVAFIDGVLYDVAAATGQIFTVNLTNGAQSYLATAQGGFQFNDISDGPQGSDVPEPLTAALLLTGLLGGSRLRREAQVG